MFFSSPLYFEKCQSHRKAERPVQRTSPHLPPESPVVRIVPHLSGVSPRCGSTEPCLLLFSPEPFASKLQISRYFAKCTIIFPKAILPHSRSPIVTPEEFNIDPLILSDVQPTSKFPQPPPLTLAFTIFLKSHLRKPSPPPTPYHYVTKSLFTAVPFTWYILSSYKKNLQGTANSKKHNRRDRASIRKTWQGCQNYQTGNLK